ncbi:ankyrin repeat protein, putative [Trichomonas vaginalis G3]|uniref:Ankyrin repeat protein, putative n=1 Tax=Trichomonas vaginalis (strain ATCC PRA-98 / G3) TaxID=412133 RepID=A2E8A1_TRIV3|nr:ankyrin repeat and SOCS box-containing protein 4 family [Trichomonas vaginalis G3]EAY11119.1 ankyrin repeat protein, putative [Trichomonas vaginalis G3]KAI5492579.1 ankyrin repeat and SOCS box-containing protein 4 family [Trichomonas vaginalis G3]|eukprot:XP_001323342.1 ankyrin repeat protein [Trichomonas vaginalis G3]
MSPSKVCEIISCASEYNNKFFKSYWILFKKVYEEYHPKKINEISSTFDYFVYKEYGFMFNESHEQKFEEYNSKMFTLDYHEENAICKAIMDDNLKSFIAFTEKDEFDKDFEIKSDFYPDSFLPYSYLELCCYHGAVDCFKFIITKFKPNINCHCLALSFLSGAPEIISECLKKCHPDDKCMKNAIISHNIDFVTYLMNEHKLKIDFRDCIKFYNLLSFLVFINQTKDIGKCFVFSHYFNIYYLFDYLLSNDLDINIKNRLSGNTALHYAVSIYHKEISNFLLLHGANVNAKDNNGNTPLHCAAKMNNFNMLVFFISKGADINAKNKFGENAFHIAFQKNNIEMVRILIACGVDFNVKDKIMKMNPLHHAIWTNNIEFMKLLIFYGADVNSMVDGNTPLHIAATTGILENAEYLISHGADINAKNEYGVTPLITALKMKFMKMAEFLILKGADVNAKDPRYGKTALCYAVSYNNIIFVQLLISHGADINGKDDERSAIAVAVALNFKSMTEFLISQGADIHIRDGPYRRTLLHLAVIKKSNDVIETLISNGCDVNERDNEDRTALHLAAATKNIEMTNILLLHGSEVNAIDKYGRTALHLIMIDAGTYYYFYYDENSYKIALELINHGIDVNTKDYDGKTALHYAPKNSSYTDLLISNGTDINAQDNDGITAIECRTQSDLIPAIAPTSTANLVIVIEYEPRDEYNKYAYKYRKYGYRD